jgi:flavin reductase (DIM6/NTAB) family NADH-FMN oxidoreductase RutF
MTDSIPPTAGEDRAIDPERFRDALGLFATGVTIVTASHPTAGLIGITANSFNSVSLDPPLVLFSVARTARSLPAFLEAPGFAVNVLRRDQADLSKRFSVADEDKWAGRPRRRDRARRAG